MFMASSLWIVFLFVHYVDAACNKSTSCETLFSSESIVLVQSIARKLTQPVQGVADAQAQVSVADAQAQVSGIVDESEPPVAFLASVAKELSSSLEDSMSSIRHVAYSNAYSKYTYDCDAVIQFSKQNSNGTTPTYETGVSDHAILVPTHPGDVAQYDNLVASYRAYFGEQNVDFVTVFSSNEDCRQVLKQCGTCSKTRLEIMVFDYPYDTAKESWSYKDKFNYQAAKKIWALSTMKQEHVLVVDSDFSFRPTQSHVSLVDMAYRYQNIMFATAPNSRPDEKWLDREVLANVNLLLDTKFEFLPLDPPWFYQKKHVNELVQFLQTKWGTDDYVHGILNGPQVFEIVLYRFFLMKRAETGAAHVDKIEVGGGGYLFDKVLSEAERLSINPPPIALRCCHLSEDPCKFCWLQVHNDRDGCIGNVNGTVCG